MGKYIKKGYPKVRKPRTTGYSTKFKVLSKLSKDEIFKIWEKNSTCRTAKIISDILGIPVRFTIIADIARRFQWKRTTRISKEKANTFPNWNKQIRDKSEDVTKSVNKEIKKIKKKPKKIKYVERKLIKRDLSKLTALDKSVNLDNLDELEDKEHYV